MLLQGSAWYITEPGKTVKLQTLFVVDDDDVSDYHFDPKELRELKDKKRADAEREFLAKYKKVW